MIWKIVSKTKQNLINLYHQVQRNTNKLLDDIICLGLSGVLFLFSDTNRKTEVKGRANKDENCQPNQEGKTQAQMHIKMKYGHRKSFSCR